MKIQSIITPNINTRVYSQNNVVQQPNQNYQISSGLLTYTYNPLFKGYSSKYLKAKAYLDTVKNAIGSFENASVDAYKMNLNKLDGIQEGINVFNGLNFKEITFIAQSLFSIAVNRGCSNLCSYCYAEAKPPKKETSEYINKMSWDDFTALTDGFKEINERLGFNLSDHNARGLFRAYITAFHDSDCMELTLKDNNNKEHDFIDISEKIYETIGVPPIFDTSGWTPKNTIMQQRAEKFAKYYSNHKNIEKIFAFNVSLNPFHILNTKSVLEKRIGNLEKADNLQNLYVKRMANTFFTFTPLLKNGNVNIIYRSVPNEDMYSQFDGFRFSDLNFLTDKILHELKQIYVADFKGEQKYITQKKQILSYIKKLEHKLEMSKEIHESFMLTGRGVETFGKDNFYYEVSQNKVDAFNKKIRTYKTPNDLLKEKFAGVLDANGDYYLTTFWSTYPTELKLNFANKNKQTASLSPELQKDLIVTKKVINNPNVDDIIDKYL